VALSQLFDRLGIFGPRRDFWRPWPQRLTAGPASFKLTVSANSTESECHFA
jgi:hypothetical protein